MGTIEKCVARLDSPKRMETMLSELGHKHVVLNIKPEYFEVSDSNLRSDRSICARGLVTHFCISTPFFIPDYRMRHHLHWRKSRQLPDFTGFHGTVAMCATCKQGFMAVLIWTSVIMASLSRILYEGLLLVRIFLFWGLRACWTERRQGTLRIVIEEDLWSVRWSYQTISSPLTNLTWYSVDWPYTMTTLRLSDFIPKRDLTTELDLLPNLRCFHR